MPSASASSVARRHRHTRPLEGVVLGCRRSRSRRLGCRPEHRTRKLPVAVAEGPHTASVDATQSSTSSRTIGIGVCCASPPQRPRRRAELPSQSRSPAGMPSPPHTPHSSSLPKPSSTVASALKLQAVASVQGTSYSHDPSSTVQCRRSSQQSRPCSRRQPASPPPPKVPAPSKAMLTCCWSAPTPSGKTWKLIWPESQQQWSPASPTRGRCRQASPLAAVLSTWPKCARKSAAFKTRRAIGQEVRPDLLVHVLHNQRESAAPAMPEVDAGPVNRWWRRCRPPSRGTQWQERRVDARRVQELLNVAVERAPGVFTSKLAWSLPNTALMRSVASCMST